MQQMHMHIYLHPTMYLLIQQPKTYRQLPQGHLHPTMYLLIPVILAQAAKESGIYIPLCIY